MDGRGDADMTPRPEPLAWNPDVEDHTPYIPRRKSSIGNKRDFGSQDNNALVLLDQSRNASHLWRKQQGSVRASQLSAQIRRFSRNSRPFNNGSTNLYSATTSQSQQVLPSLDRRSTSSSGSRGHRRLFSRIMSSITNSHGHYSTAAIKGFANPLPAAHGQTPRISGSTAQDTNTSPRSSRLASTDSTTTSIAQTDRSRTGSIDAGNSPNPLRAPPFKLDRYSDERQRSFEQPSWNPNVPNDIPPPAIATATLRWSSDVSSIESGKEANVWVAVDVECIVHYAEDSASTLRSKALGPPQTDPGYLRNLNLELASTSGCSILRLIGSHTRDILLPGETWTIVAQVLADPPLRRKQPTKAFTLQNRPHSHALMDQLQSMLSPVSSPQEIAHVGLTFDQMLLPSNVHCCTDEKIILNRVSSRRPGHGPQPLRRGLPDRKRDDVGSKLVGLLEPILHSPNSGSDLGPREATEILEDFFQHCSVSKRLQQRTGELLGNLETKLRRPISRISARSPIKNGPGGGTSGGRRNGMELSRDHLQLQDITNQQQQQPRSSPLSGRPGDVSKNSAAGAAPGAGARRRAGARELVTTPMPAPLFSPRKRASVVKLDGNRRLNNRDENYNLAAHGTATDDPGFGHGYDGILNNSGSGSFRLRFYEDEMDEASRIWRGMRKESGDSRVEDFLIASSPRDVSGGFAAGQEADKVGGLEEVGFGGRGEDEMEGRRVMLGAPWL